MTFSVDLLPNSFFFFFFFKCNNFNIVVLNTRGWFQMLSNTHNLHVSAACLCKLMNIFKIRVHQNLTTRVACFRWCAQNNLISTLFVHILPTKGFNRTILHSISQEVKHIGSTHNRSALPFSGFGSKVVTNQYNNPSGLYSSENIKNFNTAVDEVKTMAAPNEPNSK